MRYLFVVFLTCCVCAAQSITVGAIGGGRVTDDVSLFPDPGVSRADTGFQLESRFYDVGPAIEVGLTHGFTVEFDALYHRQGFFSRFDHITNHYTFRERDNSWEFPLLLKYKLRTGGLHPFVEAGVVPRTITGNGVQTFQTFVTMPSPTTTSTYPASYSPTVGFVGGGGLQFNPGRLGLTPQIRYTRWGTAPVGGANVVSHFASNQNQLDVLVGFGWKVK